MRSSLYGLAALTFVSFLIAAVLPVSSQQPPSGDPTALLMRRHAETNLQLAEVQLEMRLDANRRVPKIFSQKEIDRSKMAVEVAKEQLRLAMIIPQGDAVDLQLRHAQLEASVSDEIYQRALKANEADPSAFSEFQIKELRLKAEVARLRLAIWSNPATSTLSLMDHMHWQIERISEEVVELQARVDRLSQ